MNDIKQVKQLIEQSKKIVLFTGAGISVPSGLKDFRSSNGLWTNNESFESIISLSYFKSKPKEFWKYYKEIFESKLLQNYLPNKGHQFFSDLEKKGKEVTVITQNIDGLHTKAGSTDVLEMHGTLQTATCPKCKSKYDLEYINNNNIPRCSKVNGKGNICNFILKPDVVLFGDSIHHFNEALDKAYEADLFIVVGSSLEVWPVNQIPEIITGTDIPTIIINKSETNMDKYFRICIHDDIVNTIEKVESM
ncbi:NAD-dependent protein deacylase [Bacillus cereus]|uniref:NAD-dependent protein deacylase n=1 Tax=Bacillus cereus TaxID=1396 RepID=UPI000B4B2164|nr:NAD-dependent protein deacylase [Bacillus cereus]